MTVPEKIQEAIDLVSKYTGSKIMFVSGVVVKPTPHQMIFNCWGAQIIEDRLQLLNNNGEWHPVESLNQADMIISSVLQRLKYLKVNEGRGQSKSQARS